MKIAIGIAYDGGPFAGWQSQPGGNTVQDRIERALGEIAQHPVRLVAAGRTDAGVHAVGQVAHFETSASRADSAWVRGSNALLHDAISVQWACGVEEDFSARFSAQSRTYRYLLHCHPVRPSVLSGKVGWFHSPLDLAAMQTAAACLVGERDFSAFRAADCQAATPVRNMLGVRVSQNSSYFLFEFKANAFLHHMVRNLVGSLIYVGKGRYPPTWMADLLASRDRSGCAPTFSPDGLYLYAVDYGARWSLPAFDPMIPIFHKVGGA